MSGRSSGTLAGAFLALVLAASGALLAAGEAAAQEEDDAGGEDEPILVEAPRPFRLSASASALLWEDAATRSPEDGSLWGLEVGRHVLRWAFVRLGGAFGTTTLSSGGRSADTNTYLFEVVGGPRLALRGLRRIGVVPFAAVGVGSVIHDPRPDGLVDRSQNAFTWGAGVGWTLRPELGVRAEWRRYSVDLQDVFNRIDRTGEGRDADRFQLSVFWAF
jgi:opacity protein-like surface antigen